MELEREDEEIEKSRPSALLSEPEPVRPAPAVISPAGIHSDAKPLLTELRRLEPDRDGFVDLSYIKVSPSDINRVVNLVSALAYQLEGHDFELVTDRNRLRFAKDGTTIGFSITAPRKRVSKVDGVPTITFTSGGWSSRYMAAVTELGKIGAILTTARSRKLSARSWRGSASP
jgi:hypothetical protein